MKNKKIDWFVYDKYWRQWSRVVSRGGGNFDHEISIPLHPINDSLDSDCYEEWDEIAKVQIKRFDVRYRASSKDQIYTHELPDEVYNRLVMKVGKAKADVIMHADILALVDWTRYVEYGDTYVPFELCRFEQSWFFHTIKREGVESTSALMDAQRFCKLVCMEPAKECMLAGGLYHEHEGKCVTLFATIDPVREIVAIDVVISTEHFDSRTRFINNIRGEWNNSIYDYLMHSDHVSVETHEQALEMINRIKTNLIIYS